MYKVINTIATLSVSEYIKNYRDTDKFIKFCQECNRYGVCWACPPFEFNVNNYLNGYETVIIVGTKIILDKKLLLNTDAVNNKKIVEDIITQVRSFLDKNLLSVEIQKNRAFFAGTCHLCALDDCTRKLGQTCRYPNKIRPSLESCGFDIERTSSDILNITLQWSNDGKLPEYITLVSGLFTNNENEAVSILRNTLQV